MDVVVTIFDLIRSFSPQSWIVVAASFICFLFGALVLAQDARKRSSKFFFAFNAVIFVWAFPVSFFYASAGKPYAGIPLHMMYVIAALAPLTLYLFLAVFSNEKIVFSTWRKLGIGMLYVATIAIVFVPDLVVSYKPALGAMRDKVEFGPAYPFYIAYIFGFIAWGFRDVIKKYRESAGMFKLQMRAMLVVLLLSIGIAVALTLFLPMTGRAHDLSWAGHIAVVFCSFFIGSVIVKYNFWSFKIVVMELFITVVMMTFVAELLFATSVIDLLTKTAIAILVVFASIFLMGSMRREVESKDKIARILRELDDMHARLKVLDRKKSEFLSIASHHLRDPLTAIRGYASMLLEGSFGDMPIAVREALGKIFDSSKRLITMISDFMDISNIESGDMQYEFGDVNVKTVVEEVVADMRSDAERAKLSLVVTIEGEDTNEPYVTIADAGKIRQVISNLVDNSIKYTPQGEVSVLLSKSRDKKKILFSISDTGIGMNKSTIEKIFKKFSRAEGVNKVYTEGTGLGLYVASEIIKKHEGRVWAESKGEGHGSSFYVELDAKR